MNKKIHILAKLIEEEKLYKMAQDIGAEGNVDQTTADNLAEQVFDKLFDEMVQDISLDKISS